MAQEVGQPVIYKILSPNNRVYIGQATNYNKRLASYKRLDCKGQVRLYSSFVKYGLDSHKFEVLEECLFEELNIRERYWQDFYDVLSKKGLNCELTNTDVLPKVYSEERKSKISKALKGRIFSADTIEKMSKAKIGKKYTEEQRLEKSESMKGDKNHFYGKRHTEESLRVMSEKSKTKTYNREKHWKWIIENQIGRLPKNSKIVLNTETGIFYDTIKEAAYAHNLNKCTLADYLRGNYKNKTNLILITDE